MAPQTLYGDMQNGVVELGKEVNRHIRNILFNLGPVKTGHGYCVPQNARHSPLIYNYLLRSTRMSGVKLRSTQDFVTLIARQTLIIDVAIHSQTAINEANQKNDTLTRHVPRSYGSGWKRLWTITPAQQHQCLNFMHTHRATDTYTITYICCHEMDSSTKSILGGSGIYSTDPI